MQTLMIAAGVAAALTAAGWAQTGGVSTSPAFEAASVKPHPDGGKRDRTRIIEPGRITYKDTTLGEFIALAYGVKQYQIAGPDWIVGNSSAVTYDVIATAGKPAAPEELKRMLGPLLAERFRLQFHRETRELPVFALLLAKGGAKFKDRGDGGESSIMPTPDGSVSFHNWSMENLADWLSRIPGVGRPVVDRTGLAGTYSFHANLFAVEKGAAPDAMKRAMIDGDAAGTLRTTLPDQLGLKLEPQKAQIEILVIDHAERVPTEN
jgi:uncharacterized protein (TIGR03435 family)